MVERWVSPESRRRVAPSATPSGSGFHDLAVEIVHGLVASRVWVSIATSALAMGIARSITGTVRPEFVLLVAGATFAIYRVDGVLDSRYETAKRTPIGWPGGAVIAASLVLAFVALIRWTPDPVIHALVAAGLLVGLGYGFPVTRTKGREISTRVKDIGGAKSLFVAAAVTIGTVGLVVLEASLPLRLDVVAHAFVVLVLAWSNVEALDIEDVEEDLRVGARTTSTRIGVARARRRVVGVDLAAGLMALTVAVGQWDLRPAIGAAALLASAVLVVRAGRMSRPNVSFAVDGVLLLYGSALVLVAG